MRRLLAILALLLTGATISGVELGLSADPPPPSAFQGNSTVVLQATYAFNESVNSNNGTTDAGDNGAVNLTGTPFVNVSTSAPTPVSPAFIVSANTLADFQLANPGTQSLIDALTSCRRRVDIGGGVGPVGAGCEPGAWESGSAPYVFP